MTKKKATASENLWTPIRKGGIYCSPGCGLQCTFAEFELATKRAEALAIEAGPGWIPRVWENLGWHFSAEKGDVSLHLVFVLTGKEYFILANIKGLSAITAAHTTAKACIELARENAKEVCVRAQTLIDIL